MASCCQRQITSTSSNTMPRHATTGHPERRGLSWFIREEQPWAKAHSGFSGLFFFRFDVFMFKQALTPHCTSKFQNWLGRKSPISACGLLSCLCYLPLGAVALGFSAPTPWLKPAYIYGVGRKASVLPVLLSTVAIKGVLGVVLWSCAPCPFW